MAKKNKNIEITNNPLESVTVGTIKNSKYSWIKVLVMVVLFLGVIFFLPEISSLYEKYVKKTNNDTPNIIIPDNNNEDPSNEEQNEPNDSNVIMFVDGNDYVYNDVKLKTISYDENVINFTLESLNEKNINLNNEELFLELYNDDNFVKRIMLQGVINSDKELSFSYPINNMVNGFKLLTIKEDDYDFYDKSPNEEGYTFLICSSENEEIKYSFYEDKLFAVEDVITVENSSAMYSLYNNMVNTYNSENDEGLVASIETGDYLVYKTSIDYNLLKTSVNNNYYFAKDDLLNKIKFIMDAQFFDCK